MKLTRQKHLAEKIVFIDGLPGCGKTLFSNLVSSFGNVEKLTYSYEIEFYCATAFLNKLENDATVALIRMQSDLVIYDMMMSRNVNFRPKDLSSVFRYHDPLKYVKRLFQKGDSFVPDRVKNERPILALTIHNLLPAAFPIFEALEERGVFIEIVRHPLYMLIQQSLNNQSLVFDVRDFVVYYETKYGPMPWYTLGWEEEFNKANYIEKAILFIDKVGGMMSKSRERINKQHPGRILTIPFEKFVIHPELYMHQISDLMGSSINKATIKSLKKQNVPRKKYSEGIPLDIYKRCGWVPPKSGLSEIGEFEIRRQFAVKNVSPEMLQRLDQLCAEYEAQYMEGVLIGENGYQE